MLPRGRPKFPFPQRLSTFEVAKQVTRRLPAERMLSPHSHSLRRASVRLSARLQRVETDRQRQRQATVERAFAIAAEVERVRVGDRPALALVDADLLAVAR